MASPETRLLLLCARQCLDAPRLAALASLAGRVDWDRVHALTRFHCIGPIVLVHLLRCPEATGSMPAEVLQRFKLDRMRNVAAAASVQARLEQFLAIIEPRGWRVMLIKGAALNRTVYEQPWYVVSEDVDLILDQAFDQVPGPMFRQIQQVLAGHPGVELNFQSHHDLDMNGVLRVDMAGLWQRSVPVAIGGFEARALSPADALLAACVNLCRKRYNRIKDLMAIAQVIGVHRDLDWDEAAASARAWGAAGVVHAGLTLAQRLLEVDVPAAVLQALTPGRWRTRLMDRCVDRLMAGDYLAAGDSLHGPARRDTLLLRYAGYSVGQLTRELSALNRIRIRVKQPRRVKRG